MTDSVVKSNQQSMRKETMELIMKAQKQMLESKDRSIDSLEEKIEIEKENNRGLEVNIKDRNKYIDRLESRVEELVTELKTEKAIVADYKFRFEVLLYLIIAIVSYWLTGLLI